MPRKKSIAKRKVLPDPKYKSVTINKFINHLMVDGKKSIATDIVYSALDIALEKLKKREANKEEGGDSSSGSAGGKSGGAINTPSNLLDHVLENIRPHIEVRSRRVGGATYQVPVEVRAERQDALAMRWLIQSARDRNEKGMVQKLVSELVDAMQGRGASVKKREDMHKMARANQAFAHYRW